MAGLEEKLCPVCFQEAMEHGECRNCGYHAEESSAVKDYLAPFTILKEKYLLGKSLGQGGFGITYLAENMQSGLRCCIKEYFPSGLLQGRTPDGALILADEENRPEYEEGKQQFIEEACALQELRENISVVDIRDFFEENGTAYFAMELIEGCNLRVFRKNHNPKQTLKMALQMLFLLGSSLAEVHRFGMIHGDISPENILITQDGEIKLIDFGAARSFRQGSDSKERKIYLKPNYAPYEQYTGYEVTAYSNRGSRVDVLAPGGEKTIDGIPDASIYSTVPYGNGYDGLVGTSMACPHVAGVAAMIFGIDPTFTAKEVKDIIISTATGSYGSVKEQYPLLNARLAVEKAIKLSNEKAKGQTGDDLPFEPSGEHQYRIFYDALTWEEAKAACEAKGGHLATITSEEEQQKLNLYNAGNHKLWIGGYKNTEGQWCWVTGEPWEYENWGDGEPNNSSNVVAGESCVAMWPEKWNDLANSNVYEQSGYICEWEASDVAEETQVEGYTGHLYEFYTLPESEWESGPITWQQAERRCEWKGGHLAVIESSTENFLLYSAMKAKGYENAYFGYSDKSSEGNWKWVNGTSTAYTNWHSGEPNNQDGIEHYAMFYENFQDGTWNDADGIIDAGCAYICEWDDPTDKISQGDSFTDQQQRIIAKDLGVPDDLNVEIRQSPKAYWESAGLWDIYVEITHNGKLVASGSFDVETGEMGRNIYIYTPV